MNRTYDLQSSFREVVAGLVSGDFSALEPLFADQAVSDQRRCRILDWYVAGCFAEEPKALAEALTCACFLGCAAVADFLLTEGVDPTAGNGTGMNAFHWAANRGQLETVKLLIKWNAPLEVENMYGGTVLGTTIWSAINEPRNEQLAVIQALLDAGALVRASDYPSGDRCIDEILLQSTNSESQ